MVAITVPAGTATLYAGGSAMRREAAAPSGPMQNNSKGDDNEPATIVTLSDRAKQLMSEAEAAQAVLDVFAVTNGMAPKGAGEGSKAATPQTLIAHDVSSNQGLYIVWSDEC
jgi:hypothetical protein